MTRIIVDTRSYRGCWVAAHAAGLYDLDVISLKARGSSGTKTRNQMLKAIRKTSSSSRLSTIEIPCHTIEAVSSIGKLARPDDVIVSDSALFAYEFLRKGGAATDNFGERYTWENVPLKIKHFYACQRLKSQGINPYKPRRYRAADCERLLSTLTELIEKACGAVPKDIPLSYSSPLPNKPPSRPLPEITFEKGPGTRVFVDGDACPRLPAILEVCGGAHTPVVFVSNKNVNDLVGSACKKEPDFTFSVQTLPDMTIEKVPVEKNAADLFIERNIASGDVVLVPSTDGYRMYMYYYDHHIQAIGASVADCFEI